MSKSKVIARLATACVLIGLAAAAGVQTYRVRELERLLKTAKAASAAAPVAPSAPAPAVHSEKAAIEDRHDAAKGESAETDAAKTESESLLMKERARLKAEMNRERAAKQGEPQTASADSAGGASDTLGDRIAKAVAGDASSGDKVAEAAKRNGGKSKSKPAATTAEARNMLAQAHSAMEKGTYDDAIAILKRGLEVDPSSRELYQTLAGLYHRMGQNDSELETYRAWSAQYPDEALPYFEQARALASQGQSADALQQLGQYLNYTQDGTNVFPMVASVYRQLGMSAEEGNVLQSWAQQSPDAIDAQRMLADYYARTGDNQSSLAEYQQIAQRMPQDADVRRSLANAYIRMNMNDQAESELAAAVELQPRNMNTRLQLGALYRQDRLWDAAQQVYGSIIESAPNSPEGRQAQQALVDIQNQIQAQTPR